MENNSEKRRTWVKNAAIIFLTILLLLTFFSNTILTYSLPEVSAQYASYGSLTTAVKAEGTVKANESYNVIYEADQAEIEGGIIQSRKVVSVYVREGDMVEKDAPILELQGGSSNELSALREKYEEDKRIYELALLKDDVDSLESEDRLNAAEKAVEDAKKLLAELEAEYKALTSGSDMTSVIEARLERLNSEKEQLSDQYLAVSEIIGKIEGDKQTAEGMIENDIFSDLTTAEKLAAAESEYEEAQSEYLSLKADADHYKEVLDNITAASGDISEANALTTQLRSLNDQLRNLEKQYERDEEDYLEARSDILTEIYYYVNTPSDDGAVDEDGNIEAEATFGAPMVDSQLKSLYDRLDALDKSYDRSSEDAEEEMDKLVDEINEIEDKLYIIGMPEVDNLIDYAAGQDLAQAQKNHEEASALLLKATDRYNDAKAKVESLTMQNMAAENIVEYNALLETYEAEREAIEAAQKANQKAIDAAEKELSSTSVGRAPEEAAKEMEDQKAIIKEAEAVLVRTQASEKLNAATRQDNLQDQLKNLTDLEAEIAAHENAPATTSVTAPIAGRVVSVNYVPGDTISSGSTVASIEIADRGYVVEIKMSTEEARKIQVGAECSLVNNWWYNNIEAVVSQIKPDPSSQGKNRIVIIEVTGDVYEGQSMKFSIGDKSQSYDNVLPNSAIREDNNGKFVLTIEAKKTALGTKYTARRVDIEVIASDDTRSAVSGLYGSEFVVTGSERPISDNQQVRLAESN